MKLFNKNNYTMKRLFFFFLYLNLLSGVCAFFLPMNSYAGSDEKQIIVVFRYDDYSIGSNSEAELKIIETFGKYDFPYTFAVIPYRGNYMIGESNNNDPPKIAPLNQEKADILLAALETGLLEVAQHGFNHQRIKNGEFSGLDFNVQLERIAKGKQLLENVLNTKVETFVPPWNAYDDNTVKALEDLGFKTLSANRGGTAKLSNSLKFLPFTCELHEFREAITDARKATETRPVIVVMFHQYDFIEDNKLKGTITYQGFDDLVGWLSSQKDIKALTLGETAKLGDISLTRYLSSKSNYYLFSLIPSFLQKYCNAPNGVYLSSETYVEEKKDILVRIVLFYLGTIIISTLIAFFAGLFVFPKLNILIPVCKYGGIGLLILLTAYAFRDLTLNIKGAIVISAVSGACIGCWTACLRVLNKLR